MATKNVNGVTLHYIERGRGLPVVLVHGFPLDQRIWQGQFFELGNFCRVIMPDLRGFGLSSNGGAFSMETLADDLYALLGQIHALPCVLGGLSMGGYVTLAYQRKYPSTLRGLMLIDTRAEADSPEGRQAREASIELARTKGSAAIAEQMLPKMLSPAAASRQPQLPGEVKAIMESCSAQTMQYALAAMRDRADYRPTLPAIVAPVLIVVGDADAITPPAVANAMHQAIRHSTLSIISDAGHLTPMEQPHQFNRAIHRYLRAMNE